MTSVRDHRRLALLAAGALIVAAAVSLPFVLRRPGAPAPPPPAAPSNLGELDRAVVRAIEAALQDAQRRPRDPDARHRLAMIYHAHEQREEAAAVYEQAIVLRPRDAGAWYRLGLVRQRLAETDRARTALERSVELDGAYAPAHWRLGLLALDEGRLDDAEASFRAALALAPAAEAARFGLVRVCLLRNENERAVEILEKHLIAGRNPGYARHLLGVAYRQLGRTDEARAILAGRPAPEPRWVDPWFREVQALRARDDVRHRDAEQFVQAGRFAEALPLLSTLAREGPPTTSLLNKLAVAQIETNDAAAGLRTLLEARRIDPEDDQTQINLALAHLHLAQADRSRAAEALVQADRATRLAPDSARARQLRAHALVLAGRVDEALADFKTAYRMDGRDPGPLVNAARIEIGARRFEDAARTLRWLEQARPLQGESLLMLALSHTECGRLEAAQSAVDRLRRAGSVSSSRLDLLQAAIDQRTAARPAATRRSEPRNVNDP